MSQDAPNPPEASAPVPDREGARSAGDWLRLTSIRLLRGTIDTLEQTVEQLEASDRQLAASANLPLRTRWQKLLRRVRLRLPLSWQWGLGDRLLSALLVLVFLFPVALTANLVSQILTPTAVPSQPIASQPAIPTKPTPAPFPPERPVPQPFPPERPPAATPMPSPVLPLLAPNTDQNQPDRLPYGPPLPPPVTIVPKPAPVPVSTPSPPPAPSLPAPAPPLPSLTTTIQTQLAQVTDEYTVGLMQAIQPNFKQSRLVIQLQDGWFALERSQQDAIANALLQRAQALNFSKLEITDRQHRQLARSPVVGDEMIIFQRIQ